MTKISANFRQWTSSVQSREK